MEALPHGYPFRFVDRTLEKTGPATGKVRAVLSSGGRFLADGIALPPLVLAEIVAQAALLLEGGDAALGRTGFLAGLSDWRFLRPALAGDALEVSVRLAGRFGPVVRFDGVVRDGSGAEVAAGSVTVRKGEGA